ncbi:hypothetical protein MASR2M8_05000 [Opitutaceae bacterium]
MLEKPTLSWRLAKTLSVWVGAVWALATHVEAATVTWDGSSSTAWGTGANWSSNSIPGNNDSVVFDEDSTTRFTVNLAGTNRRTAGITFGASAGSNAFTITSSGGQVQVDGSGVTNNDTQTQTFAAGFMVRSAHTWNAASGGLTFNNVAFDANLTLSGANAIAVNGALTSGSARTLTNSSTGSVTINNFALGGTLTLAGSGTTNVTGALTFSANRTITNNSSGALNINAVTATGNRRLTIAGTGTATTTISGVAALNGGGITMNNANATTVLAGANTYTGVTTITAGTLVAANNAALGTTAFGTTVASGATLGLEGGVNLGTEALTSVQGTGVGANGAILNLSGNNTIGGTVTYANATTIGSTAGTLTMSGLQTGTNRSLTYTGAGDITVSGNITTGSGTLTKSGDGTLTLSGANTFTGATNINQGTLVAASNTALGTTAGGVVVATGATLGFQGGITIGTEALTVSGAGYDSSGVIRNISGNNTYQGAITFNADSTITSVANTLTLSGALGGTNRSLVFNGTGNTTVSGAISTGSGSLTMSGSGTLTLSGANAYTGATNVSSGTLMLSGGAERIDNASALTVSSGATFDLNGNNETVASISGAGNILLGGATLTSGTTTNTAFSGVISESGAVTKQGTGTLTLSGTNTYTGLTSVANGTLLIQGSSALGTSAGGTTVSGGATLALQGGITVNDETLTLTGAGSSGAGALRNVADTNTWNGNVTLAGDTTVVSAGGLLNIGGSAISGIDTFSVGANQLIFSTAGGNIDIRSGLTGSGAGTITKDGSGTLTLSGANNTFSGAYQINDGQVTLATPTYLGSYVNKGIQGDVTIGDGTGAAGSASLVMSTMVPGNNRIADTVNIRVNSDGLFNLAGRSDKIAALTIQGGDVMTGVGTLDLGGDVAFLGSGREATISGYLGLGGVVRTIDVASGTSAHISATINSGGYIKTGDGTLIVSANDASTYAGTTTINGGVLNVRGNLALGQGNSSAYGSRTEVNAGALELQNNVNIAGEYLQLGSTGIGGAGGLRSVSGDNVWSGSIALDGNSRINTDSGSTLLLDGVTLSMDTFGLTVGGGGNTTISKDISSDIGSSSALIKDGTGTLFLSGNSTYRGETQITNGIVNIASGDALGSTAGDTVVSSGATLQLQGNISSGEAVSISGSGFAGTSGVIQNVSGSNTLAGGITMTGASRIASDSGTLTLSGGITGSGQALTVAGAGNTTISGAISSGVSGLTKDGAGTLLLSGVNGYTGTTQVNAGTLAFGATNSIGTSNLVATATGAVVDLNGFNQSIGSISGTGTIDFSGAELTLNGNSTFAGIFDGSGTLVLNAGSSLTFGAGFNNTNLNIVLNGGSLFLNNTYSTFGSLTVNAPSILDFGSGASTVQFTTGVTANATLNVNNWVNMVDYFYSSTNAGIQGQSPLNNIVFAGWTGNNTTWQPYDSGPGPDNQITPVPEPEVYGAAFVSGLLALVAWRRRKAAVAGVKS